MTKRKQNLEKKIQQLQEQLKTIERRERQQQRKLDTRKKILIGAMILKWIEQGRFSEKDLMAGLDSFLTRVSERSLFNLKPLENKEDNTDKEPETPEPLAADLSPFDLHQASKTSRASQTAPKKAPAQKARLQEINQKQLEEEFL